MKFLASLFILTLIAQVTQAQPCDNAGATFTLDFSQNTFYVTETFTVDVILNDGECVQSAAVSIAYDDTKLTFVGASTVSNMDGGIFNNPQMFTPAAPIGVISRDVANLGAPVGSSAIPITGAVLRLTFTVIDTGFNDIEFVGGSTGLHPRIAENDGGVFTFYDNVLAQNETIENLPEVFCDNSAALFTIDLDRNVIGPDDTFTARLSLDNAQCIESMNVTLVYDPALIDVTGFAGISQGDGGIFDNPMVADDGSAPGELNISITGDNTPYGQDLIFVNGFLANITFETIAAGTAVVDYGVGPDGFNPRIGQRKGNVFSFDNNIAFTDDSILIVPYLDVDRIDEDFENLAFLTIPTWFNSGNMASAFDQESLPPNTHQSVCSDNVSGSGTIMTQSSIISHWKFAAHQEYTSGQDLNYGVILLSDKLIEDINQPFTGYYAAFNNSGPLSFAVYYKDGTAGAGMALGAPVAISNSQPLQIVRDHTGDFFVFKTTNASLADFFSPNWSNMELVGSFDDVESGEFDSKFTGLFYERDEPIDDKICFNFVDNGIPAVVLNGTPGQTNVHLLASPIANSTYEDFFSTIWTQGFDGSNLPAATSNVYVWDETVLPRNPVLNGSYLPPVEATNRVGTRSNAQSSAGRGVLTYIFSEVGYGGAYGDNWPKVLEIDGVFNSGNYNVPFSLTFSGANSTYDSYDDGWGIAGNPYHRSISAQSMLEESHGMHQAIYIWDQTRNNGEGDYRFYVRDTGGTLPNGLIAPLQGFWVKANILNDAEVRFRETQKVLGQEARLYDNKVSSLTLTATHQNVESTMMVAFNPLADEGTDIYDAFLLNNGNSKSLNLFSTSSDNHPVVVNSLPVKFQEELRIPIYLQSNFTSTVELNWSSLESIHSDLKIELLEVSTGVRYDLRKTHSGLDLNTQQLQANSNNAIGTPVQFSGGNAPYILIINGQEQQTSEKPEFIALEQNYPNPFNPSTQIRYELPTTSDVRLEVYNMMGQRVAVLVSETQNAGSYDIRFDAQNLASGVYIYRLQAGDVALSRKMTLIK